MIDIVNSENNVKVFDSDYATPIADTDVNVFDTKVGKQTMNEGDALTTGKIYVQSADLQHVDKVFLGVNDEAELIGSNPLNSPWGQLSYSEIATIIDNYYNDVITLDELKSIFHVGDKRMVHINEIPIGSVPEQDIPLVILHVGGINLTTSINGHTECALVIGQEKALNRGEDSNGYLQIIGFNTISQYAARSALSNATKYFKKQSDGNYYRFEDKLIYWANSIHNLRQWLEGSLYPKYPSELKSLLKQMRLPCPAAISDLGYTRIRLTPNRNWTWNTPDCDNEVISAYNFTTIDCMLSVPSVVEIFGETELPVSGILGHTKINYADTYAGTKIALYYTPGYPNPTIPEFQFDYYKNLPDKSAPVMGHNRYSQPSDQLTVGYYTRTSFSYNTPITNNESEYYAAGKMVDPGIYSQRYLSGSNIIVNGKSMNGDLEIGESSGYNDTTVGTTGVVSFGCI